MDTLEMTAANPAIEPASRIDLDLDQGPIIDRAIQSLRHNDCIFQRAGMLVHVVRDASPPKGIKRPNDAPRIVLLPGPRLRELLSDSAAWFKATSRGDTRRCHPPEWVVKAVMARGQWPVIRRLESVVEVPVLRSDGSVLQSLGYDDESGLFYSPKGTFPLAPPAPTIDDARRACERLFDAVCDFPFESPTHRSTWLAGLLTPLARFAFDGPCPLFLIDANVRGSGKSKLADLIAIVTTGSCMARMTAPRNDEEFRKRITALALAAEPIVLIDNVAGMLGCASLDSALTGTRWSDRVLGASEMTPKLPLYATWFATGNNVILQADTARRCCHIRLESNEERPEERSGFRHPDLLGWATDHRRSLAIDAVTMLSAYCHAGRPPQGLTPWGSFEAWSSLVRQAIVWCGEPDPAETRLVLAGVADAEANALRQLINAWEEADTTGNGLTAAQSLDQIRTDPDRGKRLQWAIDEFCPQSGDKPISARSLGMKLHHLKGRVVEGRRLVPRETRNGTAWRVQNAALPVSEVRD